MNLDNYEAQTELFPVMFHPDRNPALFVGAMEENPPQVRLDASRIDYILLWDPNRVASPPSPGFTQIYESPQGRMRLLKSPAAAK